MRTATLASLMITAAALVGGCIQVDRPLVEVRQDPEPVDSRHIPPTNSHAEARAELEKAYAQIQHLERKNADLERDKQKYKRERDDYKDRLKRYEDD